MTMKRLRITLLMGLVAMACAGPRAEHVGFVSKADVPVTLTAISSAPNLRPAN